MRVMWSIVGAGAMVLAVAACQSTEAERPGKPATAADAAASAGTIASQTPVPKSFDVLPGMPPPLDADDMYAATRPGMLAPQVRSHRELVYVPNTRTDDVSVIDPKTYKVIDRFPGGPEPQHVVPGYDLRTLWVAADRVPDGSVTPIDPVTGRPGARIDVQDVYNLYFTPDGEYAIVVAEYYQRLDFYDPVSWQRRHSVHLPDCEGANHLDFTADGRIALLACEFANRVVVFDVARRVPLRSIGLDRVPDGMPQDTRLSPDGRTFYTADMMAGGVYVFDAGNPGKPGFIPTGNGAHGIYFSRDSARMFVTNRGEGSVSVLDPRTGAVLTKWWIPGGGSPDMGGLSTDGSQLWLAGRYHDEVYVLSTVDGRLIKKIPVGGGPHGLLYWPQPGRYSLGHTANLR